MNKILTLMIGMLLVASLGQINNVEGQDDFFGRPPPPMIPPTLAPLGPPPLPPATQPPMPPPTQMPPTPGPLGPPPF
ncbi:uncharacterized proline-rich protein-like [Bradysia coprophila]|uniref:uncharacterized proline-rich protein-like n=1 Tax=Bradysia coprophila TaxID=38358 RepID=UPI00187D9708|nr:uncharacterized proline-rich protein-like [Bradysia coprophila]